MEKELLFSVVVASYNYEDYLRQTLSSLVAQSVQNFEVVVVDDGSKDDSVATIEEFCRRHQNVRLVQHPGGVNRGLPETVLLGIKNARGKYIAFCESDDFWDECHIEHLTKIVIENPDASVILNKLFCINNSSRKDYDGYVEFCNNLLSKNNGRNIFRYLLRNNRIPTFSAVCAKRELLLDCDFNPPLQQNLDWWLWRQLCVNHEIFYSSDAITYWRKHDSSFYKLEDPREALRFIALSNDLIIRKLLIASLNEEEVASILPQNDDFERKIALQEALLSMPVFSSSRLKAIVFGLKKDVCRHFDKTTEEINRLVGGNTGNLAFHYAIEVLVGTSRIPVFPWEELDAWHERSVVGIIPCANQLGEHCDLGGMASKVKNAKIPLVAVGLGAQAALGNSIPAVPEGTLNWVRGIAEHAPSNYPNISLRGEFSRRVLEKYNLAEHAEVIGCPTLFINPDPELGRTIERNFKEPKRIAYAAGHPRWEHLARLENSLSDIITEADGRFVVQSDVTMLQLVRKEWDLLGEEKLERIRRHMRNKYSIEEFKMWVKQYGTVFFDVPEWMGFYRNFDFVVGPRIHGIMLALQAGVPALCIAIDSRTHELCETMKVPYVMAKDVAMGITKKDLRKHFKFDPLEFDKNRQRLAWKFALFLKNNRIAPASHLTELFLGDRAAFVNSNNNS